MILGKFKIVMMSCIVVVGWQKEIWLVKVDGSEVQIVCIDGRDQLGLLVDQKSYHMKRCIVY